MSETMINGVDVSDCSYYNKDNEPYCCEIWDNECEAQNCYFKQCKRLKQQLDIDKNQINYLIEENEELKADLKAETEQAHKWYQRETDKHFVAIKYKQALEEINKWATNHNPCDIDPEVKCTKEDCFNCLNYDIKRIITIIDEVINDRD